MNIIDDIFALEPEAAVQHWDALEDGLIALVQTNFSDASFALTEFTLNCALIARGTVQYSQGGCGDKDLLRSSIVL